MAHIHDIKIGNTNYLIEPTLFGAATTSDSGANYSVTLGNFELANATGVAIQVKFPSTNAASAKLNVNSSGAKNIWYNNAAIKASVLKANHTYSLVYDGTQWQLVGDIDTNTQSAYGNITTGGLLGTASSLVVTDSNKKITTGAAIGSTVSSQTQSTKFLREDGTWAAPSYTTNTNNAVTQTGNTENKEFSILLKNTNNTTDETAGVKYGKTSNKLVTINPSTGRISAAIGNFSGAMTIGGNLNFSSASRIDWDQGTVRQRLLITDDSNADTAVFTFQQSTNTGTNYSDLFTIKDNGTVIATLFSGSGANLTNIPGEQITGTIPASCYINTTYSAGTGLSLSETTFNHSNSVTAKPAYGSTATTASANGGTIKVTDVQYDACGHITASTDRTITLSQKTYNFSGVSFTSGNSGNGTHAADSITSNGHWYYSSQGPASTLGAQSTDGALYTQAYSADWVGQIAQDYRDGQLFVRSKNNKVWQDWLAIPMFETSTGGLGSASKPVYIDTSGKLQECTNSIPTKISDLTNDSTFVSSSGVTSITIKTSSPLTGGSNTATTSTGTYTIGFSNQNKNLVLAGPSIGDAAAPTFRALVASDIPDLSWNKITSDKPTTLSGYGITDAKIVSGVITLGSDTITPLTEHQTIIQDGLTGATINRYGECTIAAGTAAKTVTITNGTVPTLNANAKGLKITVKFTNANTANSPTLNVNSKGAKNIYHRGAQITSGVNKALLAGVCDFIFDGTQWHLVGNYYDTTYSSQTAASGGTAVSLVTTGEKYTWNQKQNALTFDGTYNASSNKAATVSTVTTAINALDVSNISGFGATKTLETLTEVDGKIAATFQDIEFPVTSVNGHTGDITIEDLGLSSALRFVGVTTTDMTEGTAGNHSWNGTPAGISDYTPRQGDVVINSTKQDEWVCTSVSGTTYTWERLGSDTSYKIVQSAVSSPTAATTTSTTFIDTISQDANGVITATKKTLPKYAASSIAGGAATNATTTANTSDSLYLVGVKSGATSTLLHDTSITVKGNSLEAGIIKLHQVTAADPSLSGNARIEFDYTGGQPVVISYTPNDSYRNPAGLKIMGGTSASPAWFEAEGSIFANGGNRVPHTGNNTGTIGGTTTPVYVDGGQIKALSYTIAKSVPPDAIFTDHYDWDDITNKPTTLSEYGITNAFPIYYNNIDLTSTAPNPGAYCVNAQTNPVTDTTEYGSVISLPGIASGTKHYASQLYISSASGESSDVHAYIRRLTSTPSWSDWSTLLDDKNTKQTNVPTLSWGAESTVFSLNGTAIKIKAMAKPTYTYSDVGAASSTHTHGNITSDGKMSGSTASGTVTTSHKFLREDGTWTVPAYTTNTNTIPSAYCGDSSGTVAKTASCTGYTLTANTWIHVIMTTANTAANPTLNINGKGAKAIKVNGNTPNTSSSHADYLKAGSYLVFYDGTNYQFRTDGKLPGDISGNAATATTATTANTASSVAWNNVTDKPENATRTTDGFMSKEDKIKLDDMEVIKGTQSGKTGSWTGTSSVITSLYDGLTIKYYLNRDPSGNASLNLTLADGTTTGAIPCYYNSGRLTTHYAVGSVITLTYFSAGSITVNGTATTDNRWIADANYDSGNTNTATRQKVRTTNANYSLLFADPVVGTADNNTAYYAYRNDNIYVNPSTGVIHATKFNDLTLSSEATGFKISGGTTSVTLTVGASYTLGAACAKGVTDNSTATAVTSSDTNLITARTLYNAGYVKSSGVTSITLKAGAGITLDTDNTAITSTGSRTISISGIDTTNGSETTCLTAKGTWKTFNNYSLPLAADGTRGGVQIGYTANGKNYPVQLSSEKMYVNVPWTDTNTLMNYTLAATTRAYLMGSQNEPTTTTTARAAHGDKGVYLSATAGQLSAVSFSFNNATYSSASVEKAYMQWNSTDNSIDFIFN